MLRGNTFGVALGDTANAATGEFAIEGVFTLPKAAVSIGEGVALYWDNTNFNVTTTVGSNTKVGTAAAVGTVASGVATIAVRLSPTI
jgi:predicted RecA/RadA family phage recombinase